MLKTHNNLTFQKIEKKIYYHDTDCGGVVYYANYLKHLEEARTEYFRKQNLELKELIRKGILFVVRKVVVEYKYPARYGDILKIYTAIEKIGNITIDFFHRIENKEKVVLEGSIQLVCVNDNMRPQIIPSWIRERLILV